MAARREGIVEFMGGRVVMFAACTPRTRLKKTEGQALDNIAPGPFLHDDQLL
jgi:hypothetical protein